MSRLVHRRGMAGVTTPDDCSPNLPTYRTVAAVLERQHGAGAELAGWTLARSLLIVVPMIAVGVPARRAIIGSLLASSLISLHALRRVAVASQGVVVPPSR